MVRILALCFAMFIMNSTYLVQPIQYPERLACSRLAVDLFRQGNRITAGLGFFVKPNLAG